MAGFLQCVHVASGHPALEAFTNGNFVHAQTNGPMASGCMNKIMLHSGPRATGCLVRLSKK